MKKVLFFIPTLSGGGAEKTLVTAVNSLNPDKYKIVVHTLINNGIYQNLLNSNITYKSIITVKNTIIKRICAYILQFILPASFVYRLFVKDDYDIEVAFLEGFPVKLIAASNNAKAKKYTWVHIDLYKYRIGETVFKNIDHNISCYQKFDKIFCVSEDVRTAFYNKFGYMENVYVQYNVIDDKDIRKKAKELIELNYTESAVLVTVGRLCHQKGFERLVSVAKRLYKDGINYQLIIIGEGEDRTKLEKQIEENGLGNTVHLIGFVKNPYKYIEYSDLFVCSSYAEGFSTVATEAIILGKPIVTTECAGMKDLLGNSEYGLIVENSEEGLYKGLYSVLTDKKLMKHYSEKAKERSEAFKIEKRIEEYERILDE